MTPPTVLLLAGEASGDDHGAAVAAALRRRLPAVDLVGLGGPRMEAEGVRLLAGLDDLAVMGFVEVISRLGFFRRLERRLHDVLDQGVDLVLPVDYPGLNMRLMGAAHARGVPVLWYIAPQVWAWKARRARTLAEQADRIAVVLPFEEEIFEAEGAHVTFVGHPLLEREDDTASRADFCARWGLDVHRSILGLFPGSRVQELDRHLDLFLETAARIRASRPDVQPVVARSTSVAQGRYGSVEVPVVDDARGLQRHACAALVKSGTTTLETALEGTPFVVAYRTSRITWWLARRLVKVPHIALANLVAGERVVPEVLQAEATPARLRDLLLPLLEEGSPEREAQLRGLAGVRGALGSPGAAGRVADLAIELLARRDGVPT